MDVFTKICKKCLISEIDEGKYFKNMFAYIDNLDEDIKTEPILYKRRLDKCKECKRFTSGMCNACGCFVEMRAAIKTNKCPYEVW